MLMIIYWAKKYLLKENNETLLIATEKIGHEVKAEKPEHIFMFCEENTVELHNVTVNCKCNDDQQDANILAYLFIPNQLYMFRAMSSPIIRST